MLPSVWRRRLSSCSRRKRSPLKVESSTISDKSEPFLQRAGSKSRAAGGGVEKKVRRLYRFAREQQLACHIAHKPQPLMRRRRAVKTPAIADHDLPDAPVSLKFLPERMRMGVEHAGVRPVAQLVSRAQQTGCQQHVLVGRDTLVKATHRLIRAAAVNGSRVGKKEGLHAPAGNILRTPHTAPGRVIEGARQPLIVRRVFTGELPGKGAWLYSGFTWEQLVDGPSRAHSELVPRILACLDVLVDGPFVQDLKDITLRFRGSSNQRLIDVPRTLAEGQVCLWEDDPVFSSHSW